MIVALTFLIRRFIVGCKNMANYSIKFGKRKIDSPSIRGKWTKLISKSKDAGIICKERPAVNPLIPCRSPPCGRRFSPRIQSIAHKVGPYKKLLERNVSRILAIAEHLSGKLNPSTAPRERRQHYRDRGGFLISRSKVLRVPPPRTI